MNILNVKPYNSNESNNVYLNIQFIGGSTGNKYGNVHKLMAYNDTTPQALINNMRDYFIGICTLTISAHSIPLIKFLDIIDGQNNPNLTTWYLTFSYGGINYGQNVLFIPSTNLSAPSNTTSYRTSKSTYYDLDNFNQICRMLNSTLATIYSTMFTANPALAGIGLTVNDAPYFIFGDEKFTLIYNKLFVGSGVKLYFNDILQIKLGGFDVFFNGIGGDNKDYELLFIDSKNNTYDTTHYFNVQAYSNVQAFQVINQIILKSQNLKGRNEILLNNDNSILNFGSIIFSLNPLLETQQQMKSKLTFTTNGIYRLVDIVGSGEVRSIDVSVYYTDTIGNLYDVQLGPNEITTLKLGFFKKSLFSNEW